MRKAAKIIQTLDRNKFVYSPLETGSPDEKDLTC